MKICWFTVINVKSVYTVAKVLDYNMVYNDNIDGSATEANYTVAHEFRCPIEKQDSLPL